MDIRGMQKLLAHFYEERDWAQFHNPKNLVMALTGEMGELSEIFQWLNSDQSQCIMSDKVKAQQVKDEMADIFVYLVSLADKLDIDLIQAAEEKMEKNKVKYPIEKSKGNSKKYNEL